MHCGLPVAAALCSCRSRAAPPLHTNSSAAAWCTMACSPHLPIIDIIYMQPAQHVLVYLCLRSHGLGASLPGWKHPTAAAVWSTSQLTLTIDGILAGKQSLHNKIAHMEDTHDHCDECSLTLTLTKLKQTTQLCSCTTTVGSSCCPGVHCGSHRLHQDQNKNLRVLPATKGNQTYVAPAYKDPWRLHPGPHSLAQSCCCINAQHNQHSKHLPLDSVQ